MSTPQSTARKPGLTEQQRCAISARKVSVALSAGAGCGKTFVLTERFLSELDPATSKPGQRPRLSQLIAITFTERAAREMRDRIRAACRTRLLDAPESEVDYWLALIRELDAARISTIHSFCGSLLRAHAVEAQLDPQFRVLDQAQAETVLFEVLDEELRRRLAAEDETVLQLIVQFDLGSLYEMIQVLLGKRQEIDWDRWTKTTVDELLEHWDTFWQRDALPRLLGQVVESPQAEAVLRLAREMPSTNTTMQERFALLVDKLSALQTSKTPEDDLLEIREAAKVQGGGGKKAFASDELYQEFNDAAKRLRDLIDKVKKNLAFDLVAARPAAEMSLKLLSLTADIATVYNARKLELGALDFDDLLIRARQLLVGPQRAELRRRLAGQLHLLLVDEFQDTDPLQVELVEALCNDDVSRGKLFFVGDFKQSIYRFRGAQPHVFRQLRESIPDAGRLPLSLNFRSQPAILDFVNELFADRFSPYEPLRAFRAQVALRPAVEIMLAHETDEEQMAGEDAHQRERLAEMGRAERLRRMEADWIARRLRHMLDQGEPLVYDEAAAKAGAPAARAVRPGDIALLFRALSNVELYEEALQRYGIDYYLVGGKAFYSQQEVFDLANLLRAVESACDELSLAGALRSPFFGLYDETLYWLVHAGAKNTPRSLDAGLMQDALPPQIEGEQRRRTTHAATTLRGLRSVKDRVPIAQLIHRALEATAYDAALLGEFLGERKLANLQKLVEQARAFDRQGGFTLSDFITQLSQFVARQPDEALAATHPETTDVVRLMSVHQSKGLEFPVVVVPDIDRARHTGRGSVAFSPELGPMVKLPDGPSGFDLHAVAETAEDEAELDRLLYVAATRAADYLILSAGMEDPQKPRGPWLKRLFERFGNLALGGTADGQHHEESAETPLLTEVETFDTETPDGQLYQVVTTRPPAPKKVAGPRRRDLEKIVDKAREMAARGEGRVPPHVDPVGVDAAARRQFSFSRLTGKLHARVGGQGGLDDDTGSPPLLDPLGVGTLVHAVLADVDFKRLDDFRGAGVVPALVERHAPRHLPEAEPRELQHPQKMIERFLASARAEQLAAAREIYAELEFLLAWPPKQAGAEKPSSRQPDGRYLQGFIDCLYQDTDGHWRVLDYKTNRVAAGRVAAVAEPYELQMLVYALAVEEITGQRPRELVLHFLQPGEEYTVAWNETARRRAIEEVNRGLS